MGGFQPWHLLVVIVVFMLLFGANKLPQMARSVGQSMRIFKAETSALSGEKEELPSTERPASSAPSASAPSSSTPSPSTEPGQAHQREQPPTSPAG